MNRDEIVECGRAPWLPSLHARDLDPWLADDVPTLGTFSHLGETVLFCAVDGVDRRVTVWAYVVLNADQTSELESLDVSSNDELASIIDGMIAKSEGVEFALADHFEIIRKGEVAVTDRTASLVDSANDFMDNIMHTLRDRSPAETKLAARMAEASEYGPEIERQLQFV